MASPLRVRANHASKHRCTTVLGVLECPKNDVNIGQCIRAADAAGVSKLYVISKNRLKLNTIHGSSVGASKRFYVRQFATTEECVAYLRSKNYTSYATSPHTKGKINQAYTDGAYGDRKVAVWFGNESRGLTEKALENCSTCLQIPMYGMVESHNLAQSFLLVMSHVCNTRRKVRS